LVSAASPSSKAFALVGRAVKDADTVVDVGGVRVGGDAPPVFFAGPSLVETRAQIRACARAAKDAGAQILWAGCFESRASHHFVEGVGFDALAHLEAAAREVGLPFATDVAAAADVGKVARRVDMVICPERHVGDPALQRALGEIDEPVLLRRGSMASLDEHLRAAEKIAEHGNPDIVLCERAARTLGDLPLLDLSAIPALREITSLPIVVDPTHATFVRRRMQSLAADALALGAHGVILEIHPEPANALGGGQQALTFEMLRALMQRLG
jgi:3-deoxy-7-phosphoheptulonate synthase